MATVAVIKRRQRGDTIVEVMFAIAVFAFVAAGSLAVMRQGISTSMRSLEITQARQTMNDQAELLRYVQQEALATQGGPYQALWDKITSSSYTEANATTYGTCDPTTVANSHPFAINPTLIDTPSSSAIITTPVLGLSQPTIPPYPQFVGSTAYDFWVEAVPSPPPVTPKYVDFHIRACWSAPGNSAPMTLGTIVRLYDKS